MIKFRLIPTLLLISAILLSACGSSEASATPTLSSEEIQTQAVETFSAALTQTALAAPTNTPFFTLTAVPTFELLPTSTGTLPVASIPTTAPTTSCYQLTFVSDVSIPDNTPMTPGQTFTKTWKVLNSGSCAWDAGFKFASTGQNAMGGTTVTLSASVASGAQYDISVPMTAPGATGTARGNWRMSTTSGQFFGNEVYVVIIVGGGSAATATTSAATSTSAPPTATNTPE